FRLAHLDGRLRDVLAAAAEKFNWRARRKDKTVGLACGTEKGSYAAACVEIEADRARGIIVLKSICHAFECGAIVNPLGLRAQIEGCIIMGLGGALTEAIEFAGGRVRNGAFARYRVPRFRDVPALDIVTLNRTDLNSAGSGETPIIPIAPAIANAVSRLTGRRVRQMPVPMKL
ncbi:MAG: xanthine dehydrogenase family protein molybdopterin-binding subunit, partial [Burkholderiales bacterium]|nr:xanthine dehydrogenase family protein molybdopterin-binding subunit [Burkholderiales bacterium]